MPSLLSKNELFCKELSQQNFVKSSTISSSPPSIFKWKMITAKME